MAPEKQLAKSKKIAHSFIGKKFTFFIFLLTLLMLPAGELLWAHGGHGKAEVQFKVVAKNLENPDEVLIRIGDVTATRLEFVNYIRNISAFQMKADLLQRDFLLHFWVIEGISRYYPTDINMLMQRLVSMGPEWSERPGLLNNWLEKQAGLYARLLLYHEKAKAAGLDKDQEALWVMDTFSKHIKADFIEELVLLGSMEPTFTGLRKFVVGLTEQERKNIESYYTDPNTVNKARRDILKKRWIQYRRDLVKNSKYKRLYKKVESINVPPETVIVQVNDHKFTMGQFLAVYGPLQNDTHWNSIKNSRCSKIILAYALADEADKLGILPDRFKDKIALSRMFYLTVEQVVKDFGAKALEQENPKIDFQFLREICRYLNLLKLEKVFVTETANLPEYKEVQIDTKYLREIIWDISAAYTAEQASYF